MIDSAPPWITALDAGDAVVVVEENGFHGSDAAVLRAASANGRAASMFWNVNAVTRLSFADRGDLLASFEPQGGVQPAGHCGTERPMGRSSPAGSSVTGDRVSTGGGCSAGIPIRCAESVRTRDRIE